MRAISKWGRKTPFRWTVLRFGPLVLIYSKREGVIHNSAAPEAFLSSSASLGPRLNGGGGCGASADT